MSNLSLYIAARYTLATGKSHLLAFISRVSVIGLAVAVAILILVLSVMNGFDKALKEKILSIVPHASIYSTQPINNWQARLQQAQAFPGVAHVEPFSMAQVLAIRGKTVKTALLYGMDAEFQDKQSLTYQLLGAGLLTKLGEGNYVVLGKALAQSLQVQIGEQIRVILPAHKGKQSPTVTYFTLIGLIDSGTELDQKLMLTHRYNAAVLQGHEKEAVTGLRIQVNNLFDARYIAPLLAQELGLPGVQDWTRSHGNLYQAIQMSRNMVVLLVLIIIAVAAFNVVSTLVLAVQDKAADIAILRTMGCTDTQLLGLFIWQGVLIGLQGVLWGVIAGGLLSVSISELLHFYETLTQQHLLDSMIYPVDYLPSQLLLSDVLVVSGSALLLSIFASLFPAIQAIRLHPANVLRHD